MRSCAHLELSEDFCNNVVGFRGYPYIFQEKKYRCRSLLSAYLRTSQTQSEGKRLTLEFVLCPKEGVDSLLGDHLVH